MSAFADDPDHFTRWYRRRAPAAPRRIIAPRMLYGDYLAGLLAEAGIEAVQGEAVDVADGAVLLADGRRIAADAMVLAPGNFRPATPRGIDVAALGRNLDRRSLGGRAREGLGHERRRLPARHRPHRGRRGADARGDRLCRAGSSPCRGAGSRRAPTARASRWWRRARICRRPASRCCAGCGRASEEMGWRSAVHELRTVTQGSGARRACAERRRFLRHLRPWWDVHRHKLAPAVGATIEAMQGARRGWRWPAGRLVSVERGRGPAPRSASGARGKEDGRASAGGADRQLHRAGNGHRPVGRAVARRVARVGPDPAGPAARSASTSTATAARSARTGRRRTASTRSARSPAAPSGRASPCPTSATQAARVAARLTA